MRPIFTPDGDALYWYDGPLLLLFKDQHGASYIGICARTEEETGMDYPFLITPISAARKIGLLNDTVTMREVIQKGGSYWLWDYCSDNPVAQKTTLRNSDLPGKGAYLNR